MRFVLHYRGPLRANGSPDHKHALREHFHGQLKALWSQPPLSEHTKYLEPRKREGDYCLVREVGGFSFVPLICAEMNAIAQLSVILLRPEQPGSLLTHGGDIDNRLKTLFDSLAMPRHLNAFPEGEGPTTDQIPHFYCLLEDDNLVTSVAVKTEQLLEAVADPSFVDAQITVTTRVTRVTMGNPNWA